MVLLALLKVGFHISLLPLLGEVTVLNATYLAARPSPSAWVGSLPRININYLTYLRVASSLCAVVHPIPRASAPATLMTSATDQPTTGSPWLFFAATFVITWSFWLSAAALDVSFTTPVGVALLLAGLSGPGVAGVGLTYLVYDEAGGSSGRASSISTGSASAGSSLS